MIPIPPQLYLRLATLAVTTALSTAAPFVLQNRPGLKWIYDRTEHRIVQRIVKVLPNPLEREAPTLQPKRWDNGLELKEGGAVIYPRPQNVSGGPLNPHDYCRKHWWTAGPVRAVVSAPVRVVRWLLGG